MDLASLSYERWFLLFLGSVSTILVANLIQWFIRRERIYAIYSGYILVWTSIFLFARLSLSDAYLGFVRTFVLVAFCLVFAELAIAFLDLNARPRLLRWFRYMQWFLLGSCVVEVFFQVFPALGLYQWHLFQHGLGRMIGLLLLIITAFGLWSSTNKLARFFGIGNLALLLSEIISWTLIVRYGEGSIHNPLPENPFFVLQIGILLDLACVSLGLSYRQRRETIRKLRVEQELDQERADRVRQQLEADLAVQRLKQEKTDAQMRVLQSQVNPHFLFNSLNTLSSLIEENPAQASDYVDELSSVYRYLLRAGEHELTPLSLELNFIRSYFLLLATRYGQGVCPELTVDELYLDALLPPLTLQLLVENAVKHNRVLPDEPLTIRIRTAPDGSLVIENNIQRRKVRVESNGVGLSNIADKYRLLNYGEPRIEEITGWFRVTLPLLLPVSSESRRIEEPQ